MPSVNMHDAKTRLSALVEAVESGRETEVVIARNGKPAARLVPIEKRRKVRLGLAKGQFHVPSLEEWNKDDALIAAMFNDRDEDEIVAVLENDGGDRMTVTRSKALAALQAAIDEGAAAPLSPKSLEEIFDEVEARYLGDA